MRVIYNGYAATTYGKSSLSVTDNEGREVFHTDERDRYLVTCNEQGLRNFIKAVRKGEVGNVANSN